MIYELREYDSDGTSKYNAMWTIWEADLEKKHHRRIASGDHSLDPLSEWSAMSEEDKETYLQPIDNRWANCICKHITREEAFLKCL